MLREVDVSTPFFTVGPFAKIEERLDDFTSKIYLQKLYNETVNQLIEVQQAYDLAVKEKEPDVAKSLKTQLDFLENVVTLASNNFASFESEKVYYD